MSTIVITGASTGIGNATARYFAQRGWDVAATMRRPEKAQDLAELDAPGTIHIYRLDVTDSASIASAREQILADLGQVDALFNNAGYALFGPLELSTEQQIRDAYDTLLTGLTLVTKAFIPDLRAAGGGTIISTSSVGGVLTLPLTPTYHAAKYAVEGLTEGLSYELAPFGIRCKVVEPGGIQSDFWSRSLAMTEGVAESAYGKPAADYLAAMTRPSSDQRATPEEVAAVVYEAVTDGKQQWRYTVASQEFIDWRRSMTDEQWFDQIMSQYAPTDPPADRD